VIPRHRQHIALPVVAINENDVLIEGGEVLTLDDLTERLFKMPPTLFAAMGGADLVAYWDAIFSASHPETWQWRIGDYTRTAYSAHPNPNIRRSRRVTVAVNFFGFKSNPSRYHKMIDPVVMYGHRLSKVYPGDDVLIVKLLKWAVAVRDFCTNNNLEVRPTLGSTSIQLLTDPRFYPDARRKVPSATNATVREHLPGNFYHLTVEPSPDNDYSAFYLDQKRAHHYHAKVLRFPHSDNLYAYGCFHDLSEYYRLQPSPHFMGLYCLDLQAPEHPGLTWIRGNLERQFVYTNELPILYDMGYKVLGVRAAWGSHRRDAGLNKLATWACEQLDAYGDPRWLKMLLLSTYGTLATRPTNGETIFRLAKRGEDTLTLTGRHALVGKRVKRSKKLEPGIANVLHRGMIEAATRQESIGLARYLKWTGQRILSIYADAVIVEADDDKPLPFLVEPWEVKRTLNHYQPVSLQAFISDGMTKLPGVGHSELRAYAERRTIVEELQ